jgi:hypothetical protein
LIEKGSYDSKSSAGGDRQVGGEAHHFDRNLFERFKADVHHGQLARANTSSPQHFLLHLLASM